MKKALPPLLVIIAATAGAAAVSRVDAFQPLLALVVPYAALAILLAGLSWRIVRWSLAPVPFRITTVCGQQKSLAWIKSSRLESPSNALAAIARMALEVLTFRSLFRGTRVRLEQPTRLIHGEAKWLWLAALCFHWSLLVIVVRHLRLMVEPVPALTVFLERLDGFFQIGTPVLYLTDVTLAAALVWLLLRRMRDRQVRYISLFTDYFALWLLLAIALTGIWMRYFGRVDVIAVKQYAIGLSTFAPLVPKTAGAMFFVHLALVSLLAAYLPFSKLVHMAGVFLSPTRNLANNNRMKRHVNPWNYPVKVHTYEEWEEEFRDKIEAAGLPLERR